MVVLSHWLIGGPLSLYRTGSGGGGGEGGLLRINYEDLKFNLCLMGLWGFFGTCKYIYM